MTHLKPLTLSCELSKTPQQDPIFYIEKKIRGRTLRISDPKACRAMIALMDMGAVMGGAASHYGGPAALAEIGSVCYALAFERARQKKKEWYELFHLVNDAGHCENLFYSIKANYHFADLNLDSLKEFRSIKSKLTGHGEVHLFPEGVLLSNGPLGSSFPQAQGLSFADKLAGIYRTTIVFISDGACFEGEAKEAFTTIPGFAKKNKMAPFVCIVSDNDKKLSGPISDQTYSLQPMYDSLEKLGWKILILLEGNDLDQCLKIIDEAIEYAEKDPTQPVLIHAKTLKGIGTMKTVNSLTGAHGFPLQNPDDILSFINEIYQGEKLPQEFIDWAHCLQKNSFEMKNSKIQKSNGLATEKIQSGVSRALIQKKSEGLPIVCVTSDLSGSTGTAEFGKKFPDSFVDVGVAEANMISMAAGLAKLGYMPVVDTFSQFGVTKGALPLIMSSLSKIPLIAVFSHTGFQDAADGASHQCVTYFSMSSSIPGYDVYCLTCSHEAFELVSQTIDQYKESRIKGLTPRGSIFFLGRENFPSSYVVNNENYKLGSAQTVFDNSELFSKSVTIVAAGSLLPEALIAAESLAQKRVGSIVINPSIINRPDLPTIIKSLQKSRGYLVTVEDHRVIGGMGQILVHQLILNGINLCLRTLGIGDHFGQSAYLASHLYDLHQLDAKAIEESVLDLFL